MKLHWIAVVAAMALATAGATAGARTADTYDNLYRVKAKRIDSAWLLPGADFRAYSKIMLDPAEVAFDKNWQRDYNNTQRGASGRVSDEQAVKMLADVRAGWQAAYTKEFARAGYQIATAPGPDVLRIRAAVIDIRITAPDVMTATRSRTYSRDAGSATLIIEARDSQSNALLGRGVDSRDIGDFGTMRMSRNSVTNQADFANAFSSWAKTGVKALAELKANSPMVAGPK